MRGGKHGSHEVKKVGNCHGRINTLVIPDFVTVMIDVAYRSLNLKSFFWGVAVGSGLVKISYGRKRQRAQSREERTLMNELPLLETESSFHSFLLL